MLDDGQVFCQKVEKGLRTDTRHVHNLDVHRVLSPSVAVTIPTYYYHTNTVQVVRNTTLQVHYLSETITVTLLNVPAWILLSLGTTYCGKG